MRQLLVSCGGRRRPADGLRQQHVRTIRLLVWDTLEDFTAIFLLQTWDENNITLHLRGVDESVQNDGQALRLWDDLQHEGRLEY